MLDFDLRGSKETTKVVEMQKKCIAMLLVFGVFVTAPAFAGPAEDVSVLVNDYRSSKNRPALKYSPVLAKTAQAHANDMYKNNYFSHTGRNGSSVRKRVTRAGFKGCYWAENIAFGQKTPQSVMQTWQKSSGHNKNLLTKKASHFGVGYAGGYWVQVFAKAC